MENGWTSSGFGIYATDSRISRTVWRYVRRKQSESERFMAKKRPRKRANLEQRREDREIYDLLPVRALCLAYDAADINATLCSRGRGAIGHPLVPGGITHSREKKSWEIGGALLSTSAADDFSTITLDVTTQDVRVSSWKYDITESRTLIAVTVLKNKCDPFTFFIIINR